MEDKMQTLIGKTLDEVLKIAENSEVTMYVGSASSYFCIGTAREVDSKIDEISDRYLRFFTKVYENNKAEMESFPNQAKKLTSKKVDDLDVLADELSLLSEKIKATSKANRKAMKRLETFKPMRERLIRDAYVKEYESGIALILNGVEVGKYWSKDEWDADNNERS